ncbi:hypothetical protein [Tardiphaga sp.]|uniref:hypothetical protein n=1 Tax=Tardiphaga sp. TaxID=1926292 RepID=UPI002635054F|nr:hypothetical protein [Tardiphaga sp.]MDB5615802.1 hypothetical protein [Tardiphaga sp.]
MPRLRFPTRSVLSWLCGAAIVALSSQSHAGGVTSTYSTTASKDCRKLSSLRIDDSDYALEYACRGPAGLTVLKNENDLRETVSIGRNAKAAAQQPAAAQGFGPFNSTTDTAEWRMAADGKPFAMIQRWHIADNDDPGKDGRPRTKQLLVVTRLPPGAVCHTAYIDVTANPDANALARQAADEGAQAFTCDRDKISIAGNPGRATALVLPK